MPFPAASLALVLLVGAPPTGDELPLRERLQDAHAVGADWWMYNDIGKAREIARAQGKPLFVTFRCVPCEDCAAFDAEVAQGSDSIAALARASFVPVRQVEMGGVDLGQFRFDFDLNWAAVFIHPDGAVYARYGTQSAAGADAYNSTEGLLATMRRVLELHAAYPANRAELIGKKPAPPTHRFAMQLPGLTQKQRRQASPTSRRNCIHCHNIHDAEHKAAWEDGTFTWDMLYRYPLPENVGLMLDPADGRRIATVLADSPAAAAGLEVGEELTHVDGQAIASVADVQWALHQRPGGATTVTVRGSRSGDHTLSLPEGWRKTDISWRGSLYSVPPRLGMWLVAVDPARQSAMDMPDGHYAYLLRYLGRDQPTGRNAFDAGLREGDEVIAIDGQPLTTRETPRLLVGIKERHRPGDVIDFAVLRDGERLTIPVELGP